MVSRRKILSRSRDNLNQVVAPEEEEDVWYQKEKLFKEHIQEVLDKWTQIDDEIWAKVIVFERNRRVAKAYARAPVLTVNGSDDGFDGMRIGLCGFDNPMRDQKTEELKRHIGQGIKIKMDDAGNILVRRYAKSNVYIKSTASLPNEETAIGLDVIKSPNQALEMEKVSKVFDMKKFQANVNRELRRAYPDRRRLETQCLSVISFVKSENEILDCPIWVLIVNVVAMDMLKSKLPPVQRPVDIKNRPKIPVPDEDPYSVAENAGSSGSGSSGFGPSSLGGYVAQTREQQKMNGRKGDNPPKLPPRDNGYPYNMKMEHEGLTDENRAKIMEKGKSDKGKDNKKYADDPYYCGLRARVPKFGLGKGKPMQTPQMDPNSIYLSSKNVKKALKEKEQQQQTMNRKSVVQMPHPASFPSLHQIYHQNNNMYYPKSQPAQAMMQPQQQFIWHAKSFESGIDTDDSPYGSQMLARLPTRGYVPTPRALYVGEWS